MTAYRGIGSQGWATIGGMRSYFRSRWERNFARYLARMVKLKKIKSYEYEPHEFWFENIRRGVRSYKPDFRVTTNDGETLWYEVKGYYDAKSLTKIKRMAKYYPDEKLILIDARWFRKHKNLKNKIPNWETR